MGVYLLTFIFLTCVQLDLWAKEREVAGLKASLNTLMSEIQRLNKLCAERKEAEDSLKKKWKKIEEFDARRSELESIYTALLKANMVWFHYFSISCICRMLLLYICCLASSNMTLFESQDHHFTGFKLELAINIFVLLARCFVL